jgi:hypothetical protein
MPPLRVVTFIAAGRDAREVSEPSTVTVPATDLITLKK